MTRGLVGDQFRDEFRPAQPSTPHRFVQGKSDGRAWLVALEPRGDLRELAQRLLASGNGCLAPSPTATAPSPAVAARHRRAPSVRRARAAQIGAHDFRHEFQQLPHAVAPRGLLGPPFRRARSPFPSRRREPWRSAHVAPTNGRRPPARASFSTSSNGRTPAVDPLGAPRRIGDAGQFERRLVLPEAERANRPAGGTATDFRSGCINVPSAPWPESPATAATRVSMPSSSGMGNRPSQYRSTSPPMTEAPAIRPRRPAMRTNASVSQVATSRSLEFDFKAPIASVATGRQSAGRPSSPPSVSACRSASRARRGRREDGSRSRSARSLREDRPRSAARRQAVPGSPRSRLSQVPESS